MTNDHPEQAALLSDSELDAAAARLWASLRYETDLIDDTDADHDGMRSAVVDVLKYTVPAILRARANRIDADPKHMGVDLWPLEDLADELEAMGGGCIVKAKIGGPFFVRINPDTPCQPKGVHHPHRWTCTDPDCDYYGSGCGYAPLLCCECGQDWPCTERQRRDAERRSA